MPDDIDYDTESYFNQFFCITVGTRLAAMMFEREDAQDVAVELESDPRDSHPLLFTDRIDATMQFENGWTLRKLSDEALHPFAHMFNGPDIIFAHPPRDRVFNRLRPIPAFTREAGPVVSAALTLPDIAESSELQGYKQMFEELGRRTAPGLPASVFEQRGSFSEAAADAAAAAFQRYLRTGGTLGMSEHLARTWGDHGELFELPEGWAFQDNMIQNKPADDLIVIITYDADNLPNPWEWQLHEPEPGADDAAPWEQVPSTTDKPRAGWAPTLIAAMTRSATAAALHLYERGVVGGA